MKDIIIRSRHNDQHILRNTEPYKYLFISANEDDYIRVIYNKDKTIYAIDPSGGPLMSVGSFLAFAGEMSGRIIKYIKETPEGFIIEFENL